MPNYFLKPECSPHPFGLGMSIKISARLLVVEMPRKRRINLTEPKMTMKPFHCVRLHNKRKKPGAHRKHFQLSSKLIDNL